MKDDRPDYRQIRGRIKAMRKANHMTQERFAERANLSVRAVSFIETGRKNVGLESLFKISKHFDVTLDFLVFGHPAHCDRK